MVNWINGWRRHLDRSVPTVLGIVVAALATLAVSGGVEPRTTVAQVGTPEEVQARAFVLVGPEGQVYARLGIGGRGNGNLTLYDADGRERLILGGLPVVALNGADGVRRMTIFAARDDNGEPGITVQDATGRPRLALESAGDGGFRVVTLDADGQLAAAFPPFAP